MKIQELFTKRTGYKNQILTKRSIVEVRKHILDLVVFQRYNINFEFDDINLFDVTVYPWFDETEGLEGAFFVNLNYGGREIDLQRLLKCTNIELNHIYRSYDPVFSSRAYGGNVENVEIVKIDNKHFEDNVFVEYFWEGRPQIYRSSTSDFQKGLYDGEANI